MFSSPSIFITIASMIIEMARMKTGYPWWKSPACLDDHIPVAARHEIKALEEYEAVYRSICRRTGVKLADELEENLGTDKTFLFTTRGVCLGVEIDSKEVIRTKTTDWKTHYN